MTKDSITGISAAQALSRGYDWYVYRVGGEPEGRLWRWAGTELVPEPLAETDAWNRVAESFRTLRGIEPVRLPIGQGYAELRREGGLPLLCCACPTAVAPEAPAMELLSLVFALLRLAARREGELEEAYDALQELRQSREKAAQKERVRALAELASSVAHDFNNILSNICLRSEMGQKLTTEEALRDHFKAIHLNALEGAAIVRRIQEFAGARSTEPKELLDLGEVVRDTLESAWPTWRDKVVLSGVSCRLQCDLEEDLHVLAGLEDIRDVLGSVLTNAAEAMPGGGDITLQLMRERKQALLRIKDSGPGMAPEILERVFNPFFTTKGQEHVGLGLSVAHGILSRCQGDIAVKSQRGQGTVVEIRLPLADMAALRQAQAPPPTVAQQSGSGRYRVLLVDDEQEVREVLSLALREMGHEVIEAGDGRAAMHSIRHDGLFDAMILDLGMPGVNGWEVAAFARRLQPEAAVALLTGWGDGVAQNNDGRVDRVLSKPVSMQTLSETLSEMIAEKRAFEATNGTTPVAHISGLNC
jgi:signal transduction histidine kinase/ActR/RegA family two-component response regulator